MRGFRDRSQKESDGTLLEERSGGTRNTAGKVGEQRTQRGKPTRDSRMRQRKRPTGRKTPRVLKSLQAGEKGAASVSFNCIQDCVNVESVAARQSSSDTQKLWGQTEETFICRANKLEGRSIQEHETRLASASKRRGFQKELNHFGKPETLAVKRGRGGVNKKDALLAAFPESVKSVSIKCWTTKPMSLKSDILGPFQIL